MKKFCLIIIFIVCSVFLVLSHFTEIRSFKFFSLDKLVLEKINNENQLRDLESRDSPDDEYRTTVSNIEKNLKQIRMEIVLKKIRADLIAVFLMFVSVFLLFLKKYSFIFKEKKKDRDSIIEEFDVDEDLPKEMYVDDWEFQQKIEGGFRTKKEAVDWIKRDPLLKCDYCGSRLRSTMTGKREAVQLVIFYKKVPEGAKDLRVVLGSYWFAIAASELKCPGCERVVKR